MDWLCNLTLNRNKAISPQFRQTLNALIEALIKPETFKRDLFFALLLIVIKENDFALKEGTEIDVVEYILSKRRNKRLVYDVSVVFHQYQDTPATILVSSLNDTMLINAIIDATKETYSLCLPIDKYIEMSSLGIPSAYSNSEDLIISFKDNIVVPIKSSILNYHNQPSGSLNGLPTDALYQILIGLSITDILNVSESCRKLREVVNDENLWSRLFRRDFPRTRNNKEIDWRGVYKKAYLKKKKKIQRACHSDNVIEEIAEWPDYMPVRDSRWEVIL